MRLSFISLCAILFTTACSTEITTDYEGFEVHENVKKIRFFNHDNVQNAEVAFSKKGQLLYNKQGHELTEYEYDKNDLLIRMRMFDDNILVSKRQYFYENKKLIEIKQFSKNNSFLKSIKYQYDLAGNIVKSSLLTPYNKLEYVWEYEYDAHNFKRMETHTSHTIQFKKRMQYTTNENGKVELIQEFDDYDELFRERYFTLYNSIALETKRYNYWVDEVSDSVLISYEFDVRGNWVRKEIQSYPGKLVTVSREITYYN